MLEIPLNQLKEMNEIYSPRARLLVSGCSNLVVLPLSLYVTCPELIEIDRANQQVVRIIHNSFYPYKMEFAKERLYLYGRQQFAVYDLFGKVIDEYAMSRHSELSLVVDKYLITFGRFEVATELIKPQQQALNCFFRDSEKEGTYSGVMQT
jgi:hypothetical protein